MALNALAAAGLALAAAASRLASDLAAWTRAGGGVLPPPWRLGAEAAGAHAGALAAASLVAFVLWSTGRVAARAAGLGSESRLETAAVAYALGAVVWGELFLLLGLAGLTRPGLVAGLLAAGALAGAAEVRRRRPDAASAVQELREAGAPWLVLLSVHLAALAPYAFAPETFYDSLEYHLGLPSLYLLRGRIGPVPDNAFSGVPNLPSMIYGWSLSLDPSGRAAHLLNLGWLAAGSAAVMGLGRRLGAPRAGGLAAAAFAVMPCVSSAAHMTGVELAWALFQTAALCATLAAARSGGRGPWAAAGLLAGGAMACKTLAWAFPAAALAAAWSAGGLSLRSTAWAAGAAAMVLAPWLAKNVLHYGNAVYPFLHERLVPGAEVMPGWRYLGSGATVEWSKGLRAGLASWLGAPLGMLRYGGRLSDSAGPVLLGLLPAGLWAAWREPSWRPLLVFAGAAWLPLSLASVLPRYFIPVFPALALAAARAVERPGAARWLRPATATLLAASALAVWRWGLPLSRLDVFTGRRPASEFLARSDAYYYPAPLYAAGRWLEENAPRDAKVLVFGDARGFHVPRDHVLSTPMQTTVLERWSNASGSGYELRARFAAEGITHILVNHAEIVRTWSAFEFTSAGKRSLDEFWARYTRKVFTLGPEAVRRPDGPAALDRWLAVYEVLSEDEAARPHEADDLFAAYKKEEIRH